MLLLYIRRVGIVAETRPWFGPAVTGDSPMSFPDTLDLIETMKASTSVEDVLINLRSYCEGLGFSGFCMSGIPDPGERIDKYLMLSGWSEEWTRRYVAEDYVQHDPVVRQLRQTVEPFEWNEAVNNCGPLEGISKRMWAEAVDLGMNDGFCVPIYTLMGIQAAVTFASERLDISDREKRALHLVAIYGHNRVRELVGESSFLFSRPNLTPREIECLKWCAAGKTSWEIAQILNISHHTADWYLASATRKLNAVNRTQAVAQGFRRGFLH